MRRLVFDQSSPVQPVSECRGGTLSVMEKEKKEKEILVSNLGWSANKNLDGVGPVDNRPSID